jgi:hypothetical protein
MGFACKAEAECLAQWALRHNDCDGRRVVAPLRATVGAPLLFVAR